MQPRIVEVRKDILRKNDVLARELRERFERSGAAVVSLVSSPGAGKTTLLERTARDLAPSGRIGILVGDLATDRDAQRLNKTGALVRQIITGTVCHLEAAMVQDALEGWKLNELDFLFIENVGNLVCPAGFDLGEGLRFVLLSSPEGDDKPRKYPQAFLTADVLLLTKADLTPHLPFDPDKAAAEALAINPRLRVFRVSALRGDGMDELAGFLEEALAGERAGRA